MYTPPCDPQAKYCIQNVLVSIPICEIKINKRSGIGHLSFQKSKVKNESLTWDTMCIRWIDCTAHHELLSGRRSLRIRPLGVRNGRQRQEATAGAVQMAAGVGHRLLGWKPQIKYTKLYNIAVLVTNLMMIVERLLFNFLVLSTSFLLN